MTEHHGLDLDEIERARSGHSIFAPSSSAMILLCLGSLLPNLLAPDDANMDAAVGTVAHEVGEYWLKAIYALRCNSPQARVRAIDGTEPAHMIGTTREIVEGTGRTYRVEITSEMLAYVRQYVLWCVKLDGEHYTEGKVYFSEITPIPNQGGTADHAACFWQHLVITDLKYGTGIRVFAADDIDDPRAMVGDYPNGNTQALLYAFGFFLKWDWLYNFQRITIRIAQPRLDHFQTWETTREELLAFAEWARGRFILAWSPDAPRSPGEKQCKFCRVKGSCAAHVAWYQDAYQGCFDDVEAADAYGVRVDDEGNILAEYTVVEQATAVDAMLSGKVDRRNRDPGGMSTEAIARLLHMRPVMEKWFSAMAGELLYRAEAGEDLTPHGWKLADGREGKRVYIDDKREVVKLLVSHGVDLLDVFESNVAPPTKADVLLKAATGLSKKKAAELLNPVVIRAPGRQTIVPINDARAEAQSPAELFDDLDEEL